MPMDQMGNITSDMNMNLASSINLNLHHNLSLFNMTSTLSQVERYLPLPLSIPFPPTPPNNYSTSPPNSPTHFNMKTPTKCHPSNKYTPANDAS